jgi:uncharacterized membrane protein HdeD (DUF308 family)
MRNEMTAHEHTANAWSVALSILMIMTGILAISSPLIAGIAVSALIAWLLIFSGALHFAFAWRGHGAGGVVWELLLGLAYGGIGIYFLAQPLGGLVSLTLAVAMYLFVEAVLEFILWSQLPHVAGRGWLMGDGVVTLILAVMIASTWPSSAAWVVGTLIGISMFFGGISRLMLSLAVRKALVA